MVASRAMSASRMPTTQRSVPAAVTESTPLAALYRGHTDEGMAIRGYGAPTESVIAPVRLHYRRTFQRLGALFGSAENGR